MSNGPVIIIKKIKNNTTYTSIILTSQTGIFSKIITLAPSWFALYLPPGSVRWKRQHTASTPWTATGRLRWSSSVCNPFSGGRDRTPRSALFLSHRTSCLSGSWRLQTCHTKPIPTRLFPRKVLPGQGQVLGNEMKFLNDVGDFFNLQHIAKYHLVPAITVTDLR